MSSNTLPNSRRGKRLKNPAKHVFKAGLSLLALEAALGGTQAFADAESPPAPLAATEVVSVTQAAELVVTARRREEKVQDVPIAITGLSGDFLSKTDNVRLAQDVVAFAPNVNAAATDGRERPRWFLRGVGTNNTDANGVSPVGVYRDEVYLANVYAQAFPLFDQERVEILSGPQGTLWGKNTTGGAISYISKAPKFKTGGYLRAVGGSDNEWGVDGAITGALIEGKLAGRLSYYHNEDDGWYKNVYKADVSPANATAWNTNDAVTVGRNDETAVRAQLLFTPTDTLKVLVSYHNRRYSGDQTPSYILPDTYIAPISNPTYNLGYTSPANPLPYGYIWASGNGQQTIDNDGGLIRVNWDLGSLSLTSITAYEENRLTRWANGNTAIPLSNSVSRQETPDKQYSQELRLASSAEDRFNWIIGAYYFDESNSNRAWSGNVNITTAPASSRSYALNSTTTGTQSSAVFGSATYGFTDRFKLTVGGRLNRETKAFSQNFVLGQAYPAAGGNPAYAVTFSDPANWWKTAAVSSALIVGPTTSIKKTYESFTYDVTPQYELSDKALAYFHYSYGYLSGGFNNRVNRPVVADTRTHFYQIFEYQPEKIHTYELGLKTQWLNDRLTANFSTFYYDYPSIQVLVILPTTGSNNNSTDTVGSGYTNAAGTVKGLEGSFDFRPDDHWHWRAAIGLLDTNYSSYPVQTGINYPRLGLVNATIDPSGGTFTRAPRTTASLGLDYKAPLANGIFEAGLDWRYLSKQYYNPTIEFDLTLAQSGYGLFNGYLAYNFGTDGRYRLSVTGQNLADKQYLTHAIAPTNNASSARQGRPRSVLVSLSTSF